MFAVGYSPFCRWYIILGLYKSWWQKTWGKPPNNDVIRSAHTTASFWSSPTQGKSWRLLIKRIMCVAGFELYYFPAQSFVMNETNLILKQVWRKKNKNHNHTIVSSTSLFWPTTPHTYNTKNKGQILSYALLMTSCYK